MSNAMVGCYRFEPTGEHRQAKRGEFRKLAGNAAVNEWALDVPTAMAYDIYKRVGTPDPQELIDECEACKYEDTYVGYKTSGEYIPARDTGHPDDRTPAEYPDIDIYFVSIKNFITFYRSDFGMIENYYDFEKMKDACLEHWKKEKGIYE